MKKVSRNAVRLCLGASLALAPTVPTVPTVPAVAAASSAAGAPQAMASATAASSAVAPSAERPHLKQWWYDAMGLKKAHRTTTGKGVVVAVIDGYLDPTVPDLKGADIEMRSDCENNPIPQIRDERADHGTAMVTAIVGQGTGNGPGGRGVRGVAPDATVRFYSFDTNPDRDILECDATTGGPLIVKAARQGADIISISLGDLSIYVAEDIQKAMSYGAVVVAAAGENRDDSSIEFPAATAGAVAVYAGDEQGQSWSLNPPAFPYSADAAKIMKEQQGFALEVGGFPTITAPGVATQLGGFTGPETWTSGAERTGTSGATAITAGAFALLKSRWPDATGNQLIQSVIHHPGGNKDGNLSFRPRYGYGLLSILGALAVDPTKYPDMNPLLKGPKRAIKDFPASVYDASASPESSPEAEASASDDKPEATSTGAAGHGIPGWAWPLGIAALLAAAGATVLAASRRRAGRDDDGHGPTSTDDERVPSGHAGDRRPEEQ